MDKGSTGNANHLADHFIHHLRVEKGLAKNTIESYSRDLTRYFDFLEKNNVHPLKASQIDIMEYVSSLAARIEYFAGNHAGSIAQSSSVKILLLVVSRLRRGQETLQ